MNIEISGENDLELICPCFLSQRYEIFQGGIDRFLVALVEVSKALKESVHITNEYMDGYFLMMTAVVIDDDINVWFFGDSELPRLKSRGFVLLRQLMNATENYTLN